MRITVTEPKAASAGVVLNMSFAIFKASIAMFKEERAMSRRFVLWDFEFMVERRRNLRETAWHAGCDIVYVLQGPDETP